ncbi:MAG: adenylosuccinate synthase [Candidatus Velthaea sp.]
MHLFPTHPARPLDIVVGIQWGDEGKGRVVDLLAHDYDIVARFGGGDNAGHSIEVGETKIALRIVPSGALVPHVGLFIGGGTVVSLESLCTEFDALERAGVDLSRIAISDRAQIVFPYHQTLDRLAEKQRGGGAIGTTGRGIGPAYVDRVARLGVTFGDLAHPEVLAQKVRAALLARAPILAGADDVPLAGDVIARTLELAARIRPHVVDGVAYLHAAFDSGRRVLAEGAQGTMLDVGYGSYPYVTSSATVAGGACTGLGVGPRAVGNVVGIAKAYCTRVGGGPFPSELTDQTGERIRELGREFGVNTGRPRRCGWFDAVAGRYAAQVNGLSHLILTKLDILTGFERIGLVTAYRRRDGSRCGVEAIAEPGIEPEVRWFPGWDEPLRDVRHIAGLPANARLYIEEVSNAVGVPLGLVSVGPERSAFASVASVGS